MFTTTKLRRCLVKFQNKQRKGDSPKPEDMDENEAMNVRGGSPDRNKELSLSPHGEEYDSYDSEYSSDPNKDDKKKRDGNLRKGAKGKNRSGRERKYNRDRSRERRADTALKDSQNLCLFYIQGKCNKVSFCFIYNRIL